MNENERQAMLAAIRAVSSAVDDISAVVADMPGQWAAALAASEKRVSDMETAMQAVAATMAENYVRLNSLLDERHELLGGTLTNVQNSFKTVEQIIADNRQDVISLNQAVHERVTKLTGRLDGAADTVKTLSEFVADTQGQVINLRAQGQELETRFLDLGSDLTKVKEDLGANTKSIELLLEVGKKLDGQIESTKSALSDQATQINAANTANAAQMVEAFAEVRESIAAVTKRAGSTADEVFRLNTDVPAIAARLDEHEETLTIVRSDVVNLQATVNVEHKAAIAALDTDSHAYITKRDLEAETLKTNDRVTALVKGVEEKVGEQAAQLRTEIGGAIEHADIIVTGEIAERKKAITAVQETLEKTGTAVSTVSTELALLTGRLDTEVQENTDALQAVNERITLTTEQISNLADAQKATSEHAAEIVARVEVVAKEAGSALALGNKAEIRIDNMEVNLKAFTEDVPIRETKMRADFDGALESTRQALEIKTAAELAVATAPLIERLDEGFSLANELSTRIENVAHDVAANAKAAGEELAAAVESQNKAIDAAMEAGTVRATAYQVALTARVDGLQGLAESAIQATGDLTSRMSVVEQVTDSDRETNNQRHVEMLSRIQATKDALLPAAIEGAKVSKEQLESTILGILPDMLPAPGATPEQMAELQTRLLTALDSVELPVPKVPKLGFRSTYEDGTLRLAMLQDGEVVETTAVPIDVGMQYRGVYDAAQPYRTGDFVTHDGSMWVCRDGSTAGRPKDGSSGWTLAVKRGKDGHTVKAHDRHEHGNVYKRGDFLRHNNHLWQCTKMTSEVPTGTQRESSDTWTLIGGVQ